MKIKRASDTVPTRRGPSEWFTGTVWIDELEARPEPETVQAARVSFEPGARTFWHTHPNGQILHILSGIARVQSRGQPPQDVYPGETVTFAPDEVHWHGAAPGRTMVHIAIQRSDKNSVAASWQDAVADADYNARA
jgi:quercetin dioxygenase-like cupin family protein